MKELSSAGIDENKINISISAEQMIQRDGKISVQVGDSLFQFEGVIPKAKDDGMYTLELGKESMVTRKANFSYACTESNFLSTTGNDRNSGYYLFITTWSRKIVIT